MAQDATGAPTSLGIPTIDPDVDAPSGLGTNAGFEEVDTLLVARDATLASHASEISALTPATSGAKVWDGSGWVDPTGTPDGTKFLRDDGTWAAPSSGQNITVSPMADGPPSSPSDEDIWVATDVDANGTRWRFQYNAASASTYKWEFIGGAPLAYSTSGVVKNLTAWGSLWFPTAPARNGDYHVWASGWFAAAAGVHDVSVMIARTTADANSSSPAFQNIYYNSDQANFSVQARVSAVTTALGLIANNTQSGNVTWNSLSLSYVPVRVS